MMSQSDSVRAHLVLSWEDIDIVGDDDHPGAAITFLATKPDDATGPLYSLEPLVFSLEGLRRFREELDNLIRDIETDGRSSADH